jgi:hypothetical protein
VIKLWASARARLRLGRRPETWPDRLKFGQLLFIAPDLWTRRPRSCKEPAVLLRAREFSSAIG